jgi:5'-phosphate synthase pdxT subunit
MVIGVLALQGDFEKHREALARAGLASREIRRPAELSAVDGLILPGGESTALLRLFEAEPWEDAIEAFAAGGRPILATCAGLILLAARVQNPAQRSLGLLDVEVVRNAYGRQLDSFVGRAERPDGPPLEAVFIRAPRIARAGPSVEILARLGGDPVLVRQGGIYGATFHPELSPGSSLHREIFTPARAETSPPLSAGFAR